MNTSLSWIKAYVPDLDVTAQEYTDAMTLSGTKVEGFEKLDADLDKIVIGQIDKIEKHPDADKLIICQVNIGTETIQIVTGAPNVKEGDKVPVVLAGGRVAGSNGMFIGVQQSLDNMLKTQDRITRFLADHSSMTQERIETLMLNPTELVKDVGTLLEGKDAVHEGLINEVGGLKDALNKLHEMINERNKKKNENV